MFLKALQKNKPSVYLIIAVWYALSWISLFKMHHQYIDANVFSNPILEIFGITEISISSTLLVPLCIILFIILAYYTNKVLYKHRIINVRNLTVFLFILVLTLPAIHISIGFVLSIVALILYIRILDLLFSISSETTVTLKVLDLGLMLSLAALLENTAMLMIPSCIMALILLNHLNWREFVYLLTGFAIPYFYLWSVDYIFDLGFNLIAKSIIPDFHPISILDLSAGTWIQMSIYFIFILIASNLSYGIFVKIKAIRRRYFLISFIIFLNVIVAAMFFSGMTKQLILFFAPPLTILTGLYFTNCKISFLNQLLLIILLILYPTLGLLGW